jgi:peptidoglycan/LPS O-acetylase OafA/YrhL
MSNIRVYFPNLNSIRFVAALAVMIHHIELTKYWFGQPNIYTSSFVGGVFGQLGIILFFVLSGFLITYLLLAEQQATISVKNFYIRRILRIWPLYYFIVILGLFILPHIKAMAVPGYTEEIHNHFLAKTLMFLSFIPDVAYAVYKHVPYAEQAWSVGVEEQFYVIWPLLIALVVRQKKTLGMLIGVIGFYTAIKIASIILNNRYEHNIAINDFYQFWQNFSIDCMAIGGIGAYLLFYKKEKVLKVLYNKYLQIALYLIVFVITIKGFAIPYFTYQLYSLIFVVLILNLASNPKSVLNLEYKPLNYLGKISYGLYMYHNIVLAACLKFLLYEGITLNSVWGNVLYYAVAITVTVVIASLSYEYFEKWFITAKVKYSKIVSGDNAITEEVPESKTA